MRVRLAGLTAAAVGAFVLLFLLSGCSGVVSVPEPSEDMNGSLPLTQRIVVLVHGDASYLYHERDGTANEADIEALREAFDAAQTMQRAEVFVFHQRPRTDFLGLISRDDGTFYHFRRGELIQQSTYEQDRGEPFRVEADLLRRHRAPAPDSTLFTAVLYYGHAVPERSRSGYHRSTPDAEFGIPSLAGGLDRLRGPGPFDALVLSTCDGGTPPSLAALAPHARSVLASPGDLHLSFIDADLLSPLAGRPTAAAWTQQLPEQAFDRLIGRVTTAVTLATYNLDQAAPTARRLAETVAADTSTTPAGGGSRRGPVDLGRYNAG